MSRSEALKSAAAALAGAAQYEDAAAGVLVGEPTSPSGADDAAALADADRTARQTAADGRVYDVLAELRQHFPGAFAKLAALPVEGGTVATPPSEPVVVPAEPAPVVDPATVG